MRPRAFQSIGLLLVVAACRSGQPSAGAFPGTIEVNQSDAAPLIGGRIVELRVDEGDSVRLGDTLALLTQAGLPAQVEERRARLAAAGARLADLRRGSRSAELDRAAAELEGAEAEADRTARDLARAAGLAQDGIIAQQEHDRIRTLAETAARRRDAARATLELMREGTRADQIQAAEAEVRSAEAMLKSASADVQELAVVAPVAGVVLARHADPGEVVAAGTPLVTIGEVAKPWVRVYLPAKLLSGLPRGSAALITPAGGAPAVGVAGRLGAVSAQAEFTPRAALTEEERADLLFAAKVELVSPSPTLRPGLPVTVRFGRAETQ
jgi:HlyD family secretion protein